MWSNERKNLIFDNAYTVTIRCRLTQMMLATRPNNDEVYREFIASKAPDAKSMEEEIAAKGLADVQDKGITVYPFGKFWKTPDDIFYDVLLISKEEIEGFQSTHKKGAHYPTNYDDVSVRVDADGNVIPYYIATGEDVPGEAVTVPFMWDYHWRGSFKESIQHIQRAGKDKSKTAAPKKRGRKKKGEEDTPEVIEQPVETVASSSKSFECANIKAFKKTVDGNWFIKERRIPLLVPEVYYDDMGNPHDTYMVDENGNRRLHLYERPLRCETLQGPRVALASSEFVPAGTEFYFTVKLLNGTDKKALFETMDFKLEHGMLQWRSGGMGTLVWTPADKNGKPIEVELEDL